MIGYIEGKVIDKDNRSLIIFVANSIDNTAGGREKISGIGYKIFCTSDTLIEIEKGNSTALWIHPIIREDHHALYGFENKADLSMFELLISVSGIGPKTALNILSLATREMLEGAIVSGETAGLVKIAGISKKNSEKIILELKGKIDGKLVNKGTLGITSADADVMEALESLGYNGNQAREAIKEIPKNIKGANARIKEALKLLGK